MLSRYVPLGLAAWFKGVGITNVVELDWWEESEFPGSSVTLAFTPAQVRSFFNLDKGGNLQHALLPTAIVPVVQE